MEINLKKRSVAVVRKGADLISGMMSEFRDRPTGRRRSGSTCRTYLLRTPDRVVVLAADGKEIEWNYPLPPELRRAPLEWTPLPGGKALAREGYFGHDLFWLDADGKILRREHVELLDQRRRASSCKIRPRRWRFQAPR